MSLSGCCSYWLVSDVADLPFDLQLIIFDYHGLRTPEVHYLRRVSKAWRTMLEKLPVRIFFTWSMANHCIAPLASAYTRASSIEFLSSIKCLPFAFWHCFDRLQHLQTLTLYHLESEILHLLAAYLPKMSKLRNRKYYITFLYFRQLLTNFRM